MPRFDRNQLMDKFRAMVRDRQPIVGGGAGTGCRPSARKPAAST